MYFTNIDLRKLRSENLYSVAIEEVDVFIQSSTDTYNFDNTLVYFHSNVTSQHVDVTFAKNFHDISQICRRKRVKL